MDDTNSPVRRDDASLLETARHLAPLLDAEAPANEAKGALSDRAVALLRSGGFFSLMIPRCYGGVEAGAVEALEIIEELSRADGCTGWVVMAAGLATGTAAVFLDQPAADALFGQDHHPIIAGHGGPNGKAIVAGKGFRLSGNWRYGSGIKHADYIHSGAIVIEDGKPRLTRSGQPEIRIFVTPARDCQLDGGWNVLGLKATGSVDYAITDLFVPAEYSHPPGVLEPKRGGNFYRIGLLGIAVIGHTGFALGVGRRALDEIAAFARGQVSPTGPLRDSESFREHYATAEAQFRAARALIYETWHEVETTIARGDPMTTRQITLARLAMNHVTSVAATVAAFAYKAGGGVALREGPLQRCFRDINAGTQHLHASPIVLRECGRELAGFAEGKVWGRFGLVDEA